MTLYSALITLILVMDPFGSIPVFLSLLARVSPHRRRRIVLREMSIALGIIALFLFFGKYILAGLHISEQALNIAGGVILFLIALRMIFPREAPEAARAGEEEPVIVPLAVPLIAGPSTMATVILFATRYPQHILRWLLALVSAWAIALVILVFADRIGRLLGERVLKAIERLMGMILTTMAVQMLLTGVREFLVGLR
jgi:multiple antibiotic resistance protein